MQQETITLGDKDMRPTTDLRRLMLFGALAAYGAPALAYIDPGTGSMLVQGLIGTIAFAAFALRLYWHKVKRFLGLSKDRDAPSADRADSDSQD